MPPVFKAKKPVNPQKPDKITIDEKLPCEVWKLRFKTMEQSRDQYRNYSLKMMQANAALEKRLQDIEKDLSDALFYIHVQDQAKMEETDRLRSNLQNVTNQKCRELADIEAQYKAKYIEFQGMAQSPKPSRFELSQLSKSRSFCHKSTDERGCPSECAVPLQKHMEIMFNIREQFEAEKIEIEKKFQMQLSELESQMLSNNVHSTEGVHLFNPSTQVELMQQEHLPCNKDNTLGVGGDFSRKKFEDLPSLQEAMIMLLQHNEQEMERVNHLLLMKNEELNRVKSLLDDMVRNKSCVDEFFVNVLEDLHKLQRPARRRCRSLSQPRRRKLSRSHSKKRSAKREKKAEACNNDDKPIEDYSSVWDPKIGMNWKSVSFEDKQNIVLKFADQLKNKNIFQKAE